MRSTRALRHVFTIVALACAVAAAQTEPGIYLKGRLSGVPTGDTLAADLAGTEVTVLLAGIEAEPAGSEAGDQAQAQLVELAYLLDFAIDPHSPGQRIDYGNVIRN